VVADIAAAEAAAKIAADRGVDGDVLLQSHPAYGPIKPASQVESSLPVIANSVAHFT
jgi:hypothetical protein